MALPIVPAIISGVVSLWNGWMERKKAVTDAKHELNLATLQNKADLMKDKQRYNETWEIAALKETPKFLRVASFTMFAGPILMNMFFPYFGLDSTLMWVGLKACPEWWVTCFTVMNGTVWGCMELREMGGIKGILGRNSKVDEAPPPTQLDKWFNELDEVNKRAEE